MTASNSIHEVAGSKNKTTPLHIRMTKNELDALSRAAEIAGRNKSQIIRRMVREYLNQAPDYFPDELTEIIKLRVEISRVGTNLNQIARIANEKKQIRETALNDTLEEIRGLLNKTRDCVWEETRRVRQRQVSADGR